jgi:F420-non-reducing hydrogenase iron-sulfur subunit
MEGNYKAMRRVQFLRRLMASFGLEPDRLALEWVSAGEGVKFQEVINAFVDRIVELGPSPLKDGGVKAAADEPETPCEAAAPAARTAGDATAAG